MSRYIIGSDVLGAVTSPQYVVISVKNTDALIKKIAGETAGNLAWQLAPNSLSQIVNNELKNKLGEALTKEGVVADVVVTSTPPGTPSSGGIKSEFVNGALTGAGLLGGGYLLWRLAAGLLRR